VNRRSFDDAEADSFSERFAATTSTRLVRVTAGNGQILGDRQSDGSTQPARPRHGCDGAWFEIEPQRAPGPMWLLESADRSRVGVGGRKQGLEKRKGTKRRSYVLLGTNGKDRGRQSSEALPKACDTN
jgi:hypothetical protein